MFGKLDANEIHQLLSEQFVARIGCHVDGLTYVVPVSYAYDGNNIYCHTYEGMKIDMMRQNPDVCFEVDNTLNFSNWQSVIAWGKYEELAPGAERTYGLKVLADRKLPILISETMHLGSLWPFTDEEHQVEGIVFRISLDRVTGRFERTSDQPVFAL